MILKKIYINKDFLSNLLLVMILFSCKYDNISPIQKKNTDSQEYKQTPYKINIPTGFPSLMNIPSDNPMTVEGIELGRYLFYDGRLSGRKDSLMSCASCHKQRYSFEVGMETTRYSINGHPFGIKGDYITPHFMLPMINLVWNNSGYFWSGMIYKDNPNVNYRNIENIVVMAIYAPHEINGDSNKTKNLIESIEMYPEMFKKAFGSSKVTMKNISKAIAQFVRTLISSNSRFDKYLRGETTLTDNERNGFMLFVTENGGDCFHCHGSGGNPLFTTNLFYNNGKDSIFTDTRDRFSVTNNINDKGAYKASTLRNIALTGPYMHDGRFKTLDEVIDFYSSGLKHSPYINPFMHHINTNGVRLLPKQKSDLKEFLFTLTDYDFITNPEFSNPRPDDFYFINE